MKTVGKSIVRKEQYEKQCEKVLCKVERIAQVVKKKNSKGTKALSERSRLEKNCRNGGLLGVKGESISLNEEALMYEKIV